MNLLVKRPESEVADFHYPDLMWVNGVVVRNYEDQFGKVCEVTGEYRTKSGKIRRFVILKADSGPWIEYLHCVEILRGACKKAGIRCISAGARARRGMG